MKIELKNIGTVKHAEIDLDKNLLIFCGPNNSGKTYVAYALYGAYKIPIYSKNEDILLDIQTVTKKNETVFTVIPERVRDILRERGWIITDNLGNLFASNQYFFNESDVKINIGLSDEEIITTINNWTFQPPVGSGVDIIKQSGTNFISIRGFEDKNERLYTSNIKQLITNFCFGNAYIAPSERIAINIFSKEVYLNRAGLLDTPATTKSRYSLPIAASLRVAEDLSFLEKTQSDYATIAKLIEDKILLGSITVSPYGEMQFNPHNADIKGISINLAGSMVKSLASIVFYFRHLAQKGDFIIIDEPELNLHPDNQIIMARILARIVNEGFKVLISTHSDYIIKELNNLVRLNSEKDRAQEIMQKYGYTMDELLDKESLGVYLFKDNVAKCLEVDELGFDISTIEKVNSELAQISQSIYFDLLDKGDE